MRSWSVVFSHVRCAALLSLLYRRFSRFRGRIDVVRRGRQLAWTTAICLPLLTGFVFAQSNVDGPLSLPSQIFATTNQIFPSHIAVDRAGNLYCVTGNSISRIDAITGDISGIAGGGNTPASTIPEPATDAQFGTIRGIAVDAQDNMYIADMGTNGQPVIDKLDAFTGQIVVIAGGGTTAPGTTPGGSLSAKFSQLAGVTVDNANNVYVADEGNGLGPWAAVIDKINLTTTQISVVAGGGSTPLGTAAVPAGSVRFAGLLGLANDAFGNLYVTAQVSNFLGINTVIARWSLASGEIAVIAGGGSGVPSTSPIPATSASIGPTEPVAVDDAGNIYIADPWLLSGGGRLERIDAANGQLAVIAGGGQSMVSTTPEPLSSASINPTAVAIDEAGDIYITDAGRLVKLAPVSGFPVTAAGAQSQPQTITFTLRTATPISGLKMLTPSQGAADFILGPVNGCATDGTTVNPAGTSCTLPVTFAPQFPGQRSGFFMVTNGSLGVGFVGLHGLATAPELAMAPNALSILAGGGTNTTGVGKAADLKFESPASVTIDPVGGLIIADSGENLVTYVGPNQAWKVAGGGVNVPTTTPEPGEMANLQSPSGVAQDAAGNIYIADAGNNLIERVESATGTISVVAGGGTTMPGTTPAAATMVQLNDPTGIALDSNGDLYIADQGNNLVERLNTATGQIRVIVGGGSNRPSGSPQLATAVSLAHPVALSLDNGGSVYIADSANAPDRGNGVIDKFTPADNQLVVVAGGGSSIPGPEPIPALDAQIRALGMAVDAAGNIYFADGANGQVEEVVAASKKLVTLAGGGAVTPNGTQAISATTAMIHPIAVAIDAAGGLYLADMEMQAATGSLIEKLSMNALNFPATAVGDTSPSQTALLENIGNQPLTLSGLLSTTDFPIQASSSCTVASTSSQQLAGGDTCTLVYVFRPTASGSFSEQATFINDSLNQPKTQSAITLTGTASAPNAVLSPLSLTFASEAVGSTSTAQAVKVSNTGSSPLNITGITVSSDFAETNTCGSTLMPGANCTILVTFMPGSAGVRNGALSLSDNAGDSPQAVALSGNGILPAPAVTLSPESLDFSNVVNAGSKSSAQTVTLTNSGGAPLAISGIKTPSDFTETDTCVSGSPLAAGASCTISVIFAPQAGGPIHESLSIADNATSSPQSVGLSGTAEGLAVQAAQGSSTSQTVKAGSTANFNLSLQPENGATGTFTLTCQVTDASGKSVAGTVCTPSPAAIDLSSGTAQSVTVKVGTAAAIIPVVEQDPPDTGVNSSFWLMGLGLVGILVGLLTRRPSANTKSRKDVRWAWVSVGALGILLLAGCGGGGGGGAVQPPAAPALAATPTGTYSVSLQASNGAITQIIPLSLTVQ